jgi:hypothetical protein
MKKENFSNRIYNIIKDKILNNESVDSFEMFIYKFFPIDRPTEVQIDFVESLQEALNFMVENEIKLIEKEQIFNQIELNDDMTIDENIIWEMCEACGLAHTKSNHDYIRVGVKSGDPNAVPLYNVLLEEKKRHGK